MFINGLAALRLHARVRRGFSELHALSEPSSEGAAEADPKRIPRGRDGWPWIPLAELQSQRSHDCQKEFASILWGCAAVQQ